MGGTSIVSVGSQAGAPRKYKDEQLSLPNAPSELDVLWLDGDSLGVDGSQVGVFEEGDEVSLSGFLEGTWKEGGWRMREGEERESAREEQGEGTTAATRATS